MGSAQNYSSRMTSTCTLMGKNMFLEQQFFPVTVELQAFDISGVSEYTVATNIFRNRIFYIEILSISP